MGARQMNLIDFGMLSLPTPSLRAVPVPTSLLKEEPKAKQEGVYQAKALNPKLVVRVNWQA